MLVSVEISARISGELCSNSSRSIPPINQEEVPPLVPHVKTADWCRNTDLFSGSWIISGRELVCKKQLRDKKYIATCQLRAKLVYNQDTKCKVQSADIICMFC